MHARRVLTTAALTCCILSVIATSDRPHAQTKQEMEWCVHGAPSPDLEIKACTAVIQLRRKSGENLAWAFTNRGIAYLNKNEPDRAITEHNEALRLNPNYAPAFNNRGMAYDSKQDYQRAIADYNQAIRLDPNRGDHFFNRGNSYRKMGDQDRAIADYNEAIRINPNDGGAFNNRGVSHELKGDRERAIADYRRGAALGSPFAPGNLRKLGVMQ